MIEPTANSMSQDFTIDRAGQMQQFLIQTLQLGSLAVETARCFGYDP
jgi:hypothetical protein